MKYRPRLNWSAAKIKGSEATNRVLAGDGDGAEHLRDAESLATYLEDYTPAYNVKKIYLDLFKQTSVSNGQRSPETNAALDKAVEQGTLLLNYTGHGNEISLAHERILTLPQIGEWKNYNRLTFMLTATCEFGRSDDPRRSSGAELALLNPKGGAIGLLTTTRPVYATNNRLLNRQFLEHAFTPINGRMPRVGDLYRTTKNKSQAQVNNRNFSLLGDPSQRLAYPAFQAIITAINNKNAIAGATDTLKALASVTLTGAVTDRQQYILTHFNGQVAVKIFNQPENVKTLGDESTAGGINVQVVSVRENILYNGLATVKDGVFRVSFKVPKDIAPGIGKARISLYAFNATADAHGAHTTVAVGGQVPQATADTTPPDIRLYLNDDTFLPGGITGISPQLLAKFSDDSGINTTTGTGHEITLTVDNDSSRVIILSDFYTAETDNFKAGQLEYLLKDLAPGRHEIKINAWDVYNNAAEARLPFIVTGDQTFKIENILNYPNPFSDKTAFAFNHNQAGDNLEIQIEFFTLTGQLVKTLREKRMSVNSRIDDIYWNSRDDGGQVLTNGIYLYKIKATSITKGISAERVNKLMILK